MDIKKVENLTVDGVVPSDYPDFVDAYFESGEIDGRPLTEDELEQLTEDYPDVLNEMAYERFL